MIIEKQEALLVCVDRLPEVEYALHNEGFGTGPQIWKPGQRSGWIKAIDGGYQIHVRLFENGIIQPEFEIHWKFVEHSNSSWSAIDSMKSILQNYGISFLHTYTEPYTAITDEGSIPESRTPWVGILTVGVLGFLILKGLSGQNV
ncbi:MAG: hypothetical protein JW712_04510 [Dehalococcoidales bacterium]|nr:hypothetical protein [Dehalococcoidales bacterium]